jgi:hypothetical protein
LNFLRDSAPGIPSGNLISYVAKTHIIDKVGLRLVRYSDGRDRSRVAESWFSPEANARANAKQKF